MPSSELSAIFFYVYVLHSRVGVNRYIGFTRDLKKRLTEHNQGLNKSTKPHSPWNLIYYEAHRNELDARRREKYLKTTAGKRAIDRMIREELKSSGNQAGQKVYY